MRPPQQSRLIRANHEYVKRVNTQIVLRCIREHGPLSRAEIARRTELYPATVSSLVSELLEQELVVETGVGASTGGRTPVLLELSPKVHRAVGVALDAQTVEVGLVDLLGKVVHRASAAVDGGGPHGVMREVKSLVEQVIEDAGVGGERILGIGAAFPGAVDADAGVVLGSQTLPGWGRFPLRDALRLEGHAVCRVDTGANAALCAERWFGSVGDGESALLLTFDWWIGGGLMIEGRIYRGHRHAAGEFGHLVVDSNGAQCYCGSFGCLHTVASGEAVVAKWRRRRGTDRSQALLELLDAADEGDETALSLLDEAGRYAGIALAGLINALAPDKVIVGGVLPHRSATFFRRLSETAKRRAWPHAAESVEIRRSALGADAFLLGAAALVLDEWFTIPQVPAIP